MRRQPDQGPAQRRVRVEEDHIVRFTAPPLGADDGGERPAGGGRPPSDARQRQQDRRQPDPRQALARSEPPPVPGAQQAGRFVGRLARGSLAVGSEPAREPIGDSQADPIDRQDADDVVADGAEIEKEVAARKLPERRRAEGIGYWGMSSVIAKYAEAKREYFEWSDGRMDEAYWEEIIRAGLRERDGVS